MRYRVYPFFWHRFTMTRHSNCNATCELGVLLEHDTYLRLVAFHAAATSHGRNFAPKKYIVPLTDVQAVLFGELESGSGQERKRKKEKCEQNNE